MSKTAKKRGNTNKRAVRAFNRDARKIAQLLESAPPAGGEVLLEHTTAALSEAKIKTVNGNQVIENVRILGPESVNGRIYPKSVMEAALPKFNNVRVYIDHPSDGTIRRSVREIAGSIANARIAEDGIRGDIVARGPSSAVLVECATSAADITGLSINARGNFSRAKQEGKAVIEEITRLISVDLVDVPATTAGLHESVERDVFEGPVGDQVAQAEKLEQLFHVIRAADRLIWDAAHSANLTYPARVSRLVLVVEDFLKEVKKLRDGKKKQESQQESQTVRESESSGGIEMKLEDLTASMLRTERPDLVDVFVKESAEKLAAAEERATAAEAKIAERDKRDAAAALADKVIRESNLPEKARTDALRNTLIAVGSEDAMTGIVKGIVESIAGTADTAPVSEAADPVNDGQKGLREGADGGKKPSWADFSNI